MGRSRRRSTHISWRFSAPPLTPPRCARRGKSRPLTEPYRAFARLRHVARRTARYGYFDDERTRRTLALLADFGKKRQVIVFTHHRQIVSLSVV